MTGQKCHFIANNWLPGTGSPFQSISPVNGESVWSGQAASREQIDAAVIAAQRAAIDWALLSLGERIHYLAAFREELENSRELLVGGITVETGKPLWEANLEVDSMIQKVLISIEAYSIRCQERLKEQGALKQITRHKPHGVVAVLGPFNFPGHLPNGHIIPALLAGNTILFKPSEQTPLVGELMSSCWENTGLPPGVFNLLQGGKETGQQLAQHPQLNGLFFTGSAETGQRLAQFFSAHPEKILALEMGGNNPLVILEVQELSAAVYLAIQSAFLTTGQRCTCARRLIIPEGAWGERFLEAFIQSTRQLTIGRFDTLPEPFMGPLISAQVAQELLNAQERLKQAGGELLLEMVPLPLGPAFVSPGILDMTHATRREDREFFGPLLQVVRVGDLAEAIEEANRTQFGLSAALVSESERDFRTFFSQVQAGLINWNSPTTGATSAMPFGGIGCSGNHRPSAFYAADYCAYPVVSTETPQLQLPTHLLPGVIL